MSQARAFREWVEVSRRVAEIDRHTAIVTARLNEAGVRAILLKGPAITRWLYGEEERRPYSDADLLIDPRDLPRAEACLRELGFRKFSQPTDHLGDPQPESEWSGATEGAVVDLHWGLFGAQADGASVFEAVSADTEYLDVGGRRIEALGRPALLLVLALHAAKHNAWEEQPRRDLARALARAEPEAWAAAARLAERLSATELFAAGLATVQGGGELLESVGLSDQSSRSTQLLLMGRALNLEAIASAPTLRAKAQILARLIIPSRRWMTRYTKHGGRGGAWLLGSYLWHPWGLLLRAPKAFLMWRRASRIPPESAIPP